MPSFLALRRFARPVILIGSMVRNIDFFMSAAIAAHQNAGVTTEGERDLEPRETAMFAHKSRRLPVSNLLQSATKKDGVVSSTTYMEGNGGG